MLTFFIKESSSIRPLLRRDSSFMFVVLVIKICGFSPSFIKLFNVRGCSS
jgi:hypothetical protein